MTDAAAIRGTFSDFKLIKTRSAAQIVIEVPIEAADHALNALGGVPQHGKEKWVAVARLAESAVKQQLRQSVEMEKEKRSFDELPYSQQSALACQDGRFQRFVIEREGLEAIDTEGTADFVRNHCCIISRSALDNLEPAADLWRDLYSEFLAWKML